MLPDVRGERPEDALLSLAAVGVKRNIVFLEARSENGASGKVDSQAPAPGTLLSQVNRIELRARFDPAQKRSGKNALRGDSQRSVGVYLEHQPQSSFGVWAKSDRTFEGGVQENANAYCRLLGFNYAHGKNQGGCGEDESSYLSYDKTKNEWRFRSSGSRNNPPGQCLYPLLGSVECR